MKHSIIRSALIAAALLLSASLSIAAETKPGTAAETKATGGSKTAEKSAKAKDAKAKDAKAKDAKAKNAKAAAKVKLVDINSAGKAELKTLPGISETDADKIIAGRPYLTKAHLTTRNIVTRDVYEGLKTRVIAMQKQDPPAKPGAK